MNANIAFKQHIKTSEGTIIIRGYDNQWPRIDLSVSLNGKTVFDVGTLWFRGPAYNPWPSDSKQSKRTAIECVAMKPGDTDREYFDGYTEAQLQFAEKYGEYLSMIAIDRYGEE
jgi:hypothetical protein